MNVEDVAQGLERVERNPDREDDLQRRRMRRKSKRVQESNGVIEEEVEVLEDAENTEVNHKRERNDHLTLGREARKRKSAPPRPKRRKGDKQEELPIPPTVEDVARENHEEVLETKASGRNKALALGRGNQPVTGEDYRQKRQEGERIEEQGALTPFALFAVRQLGNTRTARFLSCK